MGERSRNGEPYQFYIFVNRFFAILLFAFEAHLAVVSSGGKGRGDSVFIIKAI